MDCDEEAPLFHFVSLGILHFMSPEVHRPRASRRVVVAARIWIDGLQRYAFERKRPELGSFDTEHMLALTLNRVQHYALSPNTSMRVVSMFDTTSIPSMFELNSSISPRSD